MPAQLRQPPTRARRERFTHAELAEQVGMSESQTHAILRDADIRPHLTEYWVMSELGPDFDAQAADVCGLYLDPPQNAIVVSIDEKPRSRRATRPARTRWRAPAARHGVTPSTYATAPPTCSPRWRSTTVRCLA